MFNKFTAAAAVATAMVAAMPAQAATFNLTGSGLTGSYGNSLGPITVAGITLTSVTAWSTGTISGDTPQTAYLGRYGGGLGVTNRNEGDGSLDNSHTIDNVTSYDFVRLEFSTAVSLSGLIRNGYDVGGPAPAGDTDAWISFGTASNTFGAGTGTGTANTGWAGFVARGLPVASGASILNTNYSTVWIIGADRSGSNRNDGFKLAGITALTPSVPEPATWGMMILGFGAIGGAMRRRKVAAKISFA